MSLWQNKPDLTILTPNQKLFPKTKRNKNSKYQLTSKKQLGFETENMLIHREAGSVSIPNHGEY